MKHEYTLDELRELKSIYDESGEAGLSRDEMRALRKAGLVKQDLPPEPEKPHEDTLADYQALSTPEPETPKRKPANTNRHPEMRQAVYDTIADFCASGHVPTIQKIADSLHKSKSTIANHVLALAKEGRISKDPKTGRYHTTNTTNTTETTEKKETIMTVTQKLTADASTSTQKLTADNVTTTKLTPTAFTAGTISVGPQATADPRIIIANALVDIFDAVSALQRTAFQANDKVVYGFATKLLTGELMDIKANYSKNAK